ncbi:MAG: TrkA C-terminal domain-containing protein [Akkermansiaceae bacterium]|nr:TrkA C-terminal domain-containing protein [Akkermansiaceae bacterium]
MIGLVGILALLTVLALSMVVTRVATIALACTGLSHEAAKFQARSAFTGTGFTTSESEKVVDHPVRRRIINLMMLLRSAGIVSILISLILSFAGESTELEILTRLSVLVVGLLALWGLLSMKAVNHALTRRIENLLQKFYDLDTRDYGSLLRLSGEYRVLELRIDDEDWIEGQSLKESKLDEEGVRVLGIYRKDGSYLGTPKGAAKVREGDTLVLYGQAERLHELDKRRKDSSGENAHKDAVAQHRKDEEEAAREDEAKTEGQSQKEDAEEKD